MCTKIVQIQYTLSLDSQHQGLPGGNARALHCGGSARLPAKGPADR